MIRKTLFAALAAATLGCAGTTPPPSEPIDVDLTLETPDGVEGVRSVLLRQEPNGEQELMFFAEEGIRCADVRDTLLEAPLMVAEMDQGPYDNTVPDLLPPATWKWDFDSHEGEAPQAFGRVSVTRAEGDRIEGVVDFAHEGVTLKGPYRALVCNTEAGATDRTGPAAPTSTGS